MREHSRYGLTRTNAAYVFFLCETLPTWISLVDWVLFFSRFIRRQWRCFFSIEEDE